MSPQPVDRLTGDRVHQERVAIIFHEREQGPLGIHVEDPEVSSGSRQTVSPDTTSYAVSGRPV